MARRNRIIMVKRDILERVTLPNSRTFLAHYRQTTRAHLPENIHLERPYKEHPAPKGKRRRCQVITQQGQGIGNIFRFVKRVAKVRLDVMLEKWLLNNFLVCMKSYLVK